MTISEYISLAYGESFGNPIPEDIRASLEAKTAEVVQLSDGGYIGIEKPRIIDYDPEYITAFDYGRYLLNTLVKYEKKIKEDEYFKEYGYCKTTDYKGIYKEYLFGSTIFILEKGKIKHLSEDDFSAIINGEIKFSVRLANKTMGFYRSHGLNESDIVYRNSELSRKEEEHLFNKELDIRKLLSSIQEEKDASTKQKLGILTRGLTK